VKHPAFDYDGISNIFARLDAISSQSVVCSKTMISFPIMSHQEANAL
jgi:hypothetical protein